LPFSLSIYLFIYFLFIPILKSIFAHYSALVVAPSQPQQCRAGFNAWLAWRLLVDLVLAMDPASYVLLCVVFADWPWQIQVDGLVLLSYLVSTTGAPSLLSRQILTRALLFQAGAALIGFSVGAKMDAYRVVEDYAWCTTTLLPPHSHRRSLR
jgi:hypothetical protein